MTSDRLPRRLVIAVAIAALAAGAAVVAVRGGRRDRSDDRAGRVGPGRSEPGAKGLGALRIESWGNSSDAPRGASAAPRKAALGGAPAPVLLKKESASLLGIEEARKTLSVEERGAGKQVGNFVLGRDEVLKERNGSYGFGNAAYGATIGKGRVDFARPLSLKDVGQPRLSFDLDEVKMGPASLARGGDAPARADADSRTVSFDRGAVEEKYLLRPDAIEQSFVIRSLPPERSDITVCGRVTTNLVPPAEGTVGARLAFTAGTSEALTISDAVAIDASGRRQELALAYAGGKVSMTVPASWVAGAALPITIDPLMGGPVTVDGAVNSTVAQVNGVPVRASDVCYNALQNEWIVVWQEQFGADAFNFDVYAQRVDASGNLVGSAIPVSVTGAGEYEPAVCWAPSVNRYLVAWRHDPADDSSDADQFIAGRVLNADGTFLTSSFVVDDVAGQDFGPSLAFDGTNWFCVFTNVVSATDTNVIGRFVATDGTPGTEVTFDSDSDLAAAPAVDVAGGTYLVAWQKGVSGGPMSVVGRTMNTSGTLLNGITAIDQSAADCSAPDVSSSGTQFLVVWQQTASATDRNVVGRRVALSGSPTGNAINIRATTADQLTPRAKWTSTNSWWYVVYSDTTNTDADVYGSRVDGTGKLYGANRITSVAVDEVRPVLAWNSADDEMLVCYLCGAASPFQIKAQRVSMDFTAPTVPGVPVAAPNPSGTGSFTLTWAATVETGGSGFAKYDLERSCNAGSSWTLVASPTTESYIDTMPFGEYVYRVRASDLAGNNSAYSAASAVVAVENLPPPEPVDLAQFQSDGVTPIAPGGTAPGTGVVLGATVNSLGLLDGFEDGNFTVDPMWTVGAGTWAISTDGNKVLHDGAALDDQIYTASAQSSGSWEYRFRWPTITTGATVNLQAGFYLFLDSAGLGGNGYQVLVTAGAASTKSVSLYRVDGASTTGLVGWNWTPDTAFHIVRVNRSASGRFDLYFDGALVGSAIDATYSTAVSTLIRNVTTNGNTLRVDYVRTSSALVARPAVKLQVEVKPFGTPFNGTGLIDSAFVAGGGSAVQVVLSSLPDGSYHWRARVSDPLGNASPFTSFEGIAATGADFVVLSTPPPAAPTGLVAVPGSGQVSLSWTSVSGAASYTVKRSPTTGGPYTVQASGLSLTTFPDTAVQNGSTYYYVVSATNAGGESPNSSEVSATPLAPPSAPSGLSAVAGNGQVVLSWGSVSGATSYTLRRSASAAGPFGPIAPGLTATTYTDGGLQNGATYYYAVSALNAGGESSNSNVVSATPIAPPAPPTGLGAQAGNQRISLSWNVTAGASSYTLKRGTTPGGPYAPAASGLTGTVFTDTGLVNGTRYYYVVSATNAGGEGGNSVEAAATPFGVPDAPVNLLATPRNGQVQLTWTGSAQAVSYTVKRGSVTGGPYSILAAGLTLIAYTDRSVTNGTAYFYIVTATNAAGESGASNEASATPTAPPGAPSGLVAKGGNGQAILSWAPVDGATNYEVLRAVKTGGPYTLVGPSVAAPAYVDSGLTNGIAYFYIVRAVTAGIESGDSNEAVAIPTLGPPVPTNLTATRGPGQISLSWVASAGAVGYHVKRSTTAGGPYTQIGSPTSPSFVDSSLLTGTAYYYVVSAFNDGGESPDSQEVAFIGGASVTDLEGETDSDGTNFLDWTGLPGADIVGYNIYRSLQPGGPFVLVGANDPNYYYVDGSPSNPLINNTTYYYFIRAVDSSGKELGDSNLVSVTATTVDLVFFGYGVSTSSIFWIWYVDNAIDPTWTSFELHDDQHRVIYSLPITPTLDTSFMSYTEMGLSENALTSRHIHPKTATGYGPIYLTRDTYTYVHHATSSDFSLSASSPGAVDITITPPPNGTSGYTGVYIYRVTSSGATPIAGFVGNYTYRDTGLEAGTTYSYQIQYINGQQTTSGMSPLNSVTTTSAPVGLVGTAQSTTSIMWFWHREDGASGYELHDDQHNVISSTIDPTFTETGLFENTSYSRHVHAILPSGLTPASNSFACYTRIRDAGAGDFNVLATGATQVQVTVNPPPNPTGGVTGVEISRSLNGFSWTVIQPFSSSYTFPDSGLTGQTPYYYQIRFQNGDGVPGDYSPSAIVQTPTGPPPAPSGFSGVAMSTQSIHWTWSDVPGALGFEVHDDQHNVIAPVGEGVTFFDETNLAENSRTSRHVHAVGPASQLSPASGTVAVFTLVHPPGAGDFTLLVARLDRIDIAILPPPNPLSGQTGGEVQRLDASGWNLLQGFTTTYSFSDTSLQAGTSYTYRINLRNGDGIEAGWSPGTSATTFSLAPPVITTASKKTRSTTPKIVGTAAPGETLTMLFGGIQDGTAVANSSGAWTYVATLKAEGIYPVVAYGSSSGYSNGITVQVDLSPPAAPGNVRVRTYSSAADVLWDGSSSADVAGYNVYRKIGPNGSWTLLNTSGLILNTKYRDTGLTLGQTYFYRVTAVDNSVSD